jgi:hypothetical protein
MGPMSPPKAQRATLAQLAAALLVAQLAVRGWVAWRGGFYWDDLVLEGRASTSSIWSQEYLLGSHDGHVMPGAFLVAGVTTKLAPLRWAPAFIELLVLQTLASLAVLRLVRLILGWRPLTVALFAWYLFTPLTLPSFVWWSAALNALPLHAGLAWVAGETLLLVRTRRTRHTMSALLGFVVALAFFEKALFIPFAATAIAVLDLSITGHRHPIRTALRRSRQLWAGYAAVLSLWAAVCCWAAPHHGGLPPARTIMETFWRENVRGLLPAVFGGPLSWKRQQPIVAVAEPPAALAAAAVLGAVLVVAISARRAPRGGAVWLVFFGYAAACEAVLLFWRVSLNPDPAVGLSVRYVADCAVVLVTALALLARRQHRRQPWALAAAGAVCCVGLVSTATFDDIWSDNPTNAYLATVRHELAAHRATPLLDQPVPYTVLSWISYPDNLMSHVFAAVRERPAFATSTTVLRFVDDQGRLVPGQVSSVRTIRQGPVPGCGDRVEPQTARALPLDGPLFDWQWTAQLNYFSTADGDVDVRLPTGDAQRVPVSSGLHTVFVRLDGAGSAIILRPVTPGLSLCVGSGPVGAVWPQ